ncbi:MAG: hypothetical protein ABEJ87_00585 [Candidatus Nanohalobium sp.]
MMPVETAFGFTGAAIFLLMIYYSKKSLDHFEEHRDVSMVRFFIDKRGGRAFQLLAGTALIYAIAMVVTGMEFYYGSYALLVSSRGLIIAVGLLLALFLREVYLVTKKNPEEN